MAKTKNIGAPGLDYEKELWATAIHRVAGVDEVGRGAMAGPVVCACVIYPVDLDPALLIGVRDSKDTSAKERAELAETILTYALSVGIGAASVREIDRLNIRVATALAMNRAIRRAGGVEHALVDGLPMPEITVAQTAIVKGDSVSLSIASASILAKQVRDHGMQKLADRYPMYGWDRNVGYGTAQHRTAIVDHGRSPHHRRSFGSEQLSLGI